MPTFTTREAPIEIPGGGGLCRIDVGWVFLPYGVPQQRVRVRMDGVVLGEAALTGPCTIEFMAPRGGGATLELVDAKSPIELGINQDPRFLSIGMAGITAETSTEAFAGLRVAGREIDRLVASTGLTSSELAMRFTSLGMQCEFGLVQREMGAEPLGLLRFSNTPIEALIRLLEARCHGLGAPGSLETRLFSDAQEFIVEDRTYGLVYHTWQYAASTTAEAVLEQETVRLPFLARHLMETLEDATSILVFKDPVGTVTMEQERQLADVLRRFGRNRLLVVQPVLDARAGQLTDMGDGLWRGLVGYGGPDYWQIKTDWLPVLVRMFLEAEGR